MHIKFYPFIFASIAKTTLIRLLERDFGIQRVSLDPHRKLSLRALSKEKNAESRKFLKIQEIILRRGVIWEKLRENVI